MRRCDFSTYSKIRKKDIKKVSKKNAILVENKVDYKSNNFHQYESVLVLNQSYEPLTVCSPFKAITLLFLSKAELIIAREDKVLTSINQTFPFPSVIKLNKYRRIIFREIEVSRKNVFKRDQYTCQYCNSNNHLLTVDHIIPKSKGGLDTWENLITACFRCNNKKGDRTPAEAKMPLLSTPVKPSYFNFFNLGIENSHFEWKKFMYQ
ncbi:MAG: HNH endonuclease [Candidatus Kapaibacteriota bacterium]